VPDIRLHQISYFTNLDENVDSFPRNLLVLGRAAISPRVRQMYDVLDSEAPGETRTA